VKGDLIFAATTGALTIIGHWFAYECTQVRRASRLRIEPWHPPRQRKGST
jgi:hypothetical protein